MICQKCNNILPDNSKFCQFCGSEIISISNKCCINCGLLLSENDRFCSYCGCVVIENKVAFNQIPINKLEGNEVLHNSIVENTSLLESESPSKRISSTKRKTTTKMIIGMILCASAIVLAIILTRPTDETKQEMYDRLCSSVVLLEVYDDTDTVIATASGFFINDDRTILTNYHVIEDAYSIIALTENGDSFAIHNILNINEPADIVIFSCAVNTGIQPLILADSDFAKKGDDIFTIGSPLGLRNSVSEGIISALWNDESIDYLQITAAISSGSSGGALFNSSGEVIGVTTAYFVDAQNLNIAVASNEIIDLAMGDNPVTLADFYIINHNESIEIANERSIDSNDSSITSTNISSPDKDTNTDIEKIDYTISVSPESATITVGETIQIMITHNNGTVGVFSKTVNYDYVNGTFSQGYHWDNNFTTFDITGLTAGVATIQFYYNTPTDEVIMSDPIQITIIE